MPNISQAQINTFTTELMVGSEIMADQQGGKFCRLGRFP